MLVSLKHSKCVYVLQSGSTFFIPSRASVIKEYGVYWDEINVTLNCKSSFGIMFHL